MGVLHSAQKILFTSFTILVIGTWINSITIPLQTLLNFPKMFSSLPAYFLISHPIILVGLFEHQYRYNGWHASRISYWNTHKPVRFVLSYVLCISQQYKQRTAWKASLQSIQPLRKIRRIYSWNVHPISRYVKAIMPKFQPCQTCFTNIVSKA